MKRWAYSQVFCGLSMHNINYTSIYINYYKNIIKLHCIKLKIIHIIINKFIYRNQENKKINSSRQYKRVQNNHFSHAGKNTFYELFLFLNRSSFFTRTLSKGNLSKCISTDRLWICIWKNYVQYGWKDAVLEILSLSILVDLYIKILIFGPGRPTLQTSFLLTNRRSRH